MASSQKINAQDYSFQFYESKDTSLMSTSDVDSSLSASSCIEFIVYDLNKNCLTTSYDFQSYTLDSGDMSANSNGDSISKFNINPTEDVSSAGFNVGDYVGYYNFLNKRVGDNFTTLYISEISSDRTEIRLSSNSLTRLDLKEQVNSFIKFREDQNYFVDFFLNFGKNKLVICNNIKLEGENTKNPTVLVKLYEPLPSEFEIKSQLWVVTQISEPEAFQVTFLPELSFQISTEDILGPNFNIPIKSQVNNSSGKLSENSILSGAPTSSLNHLESLLNEKSINISVDYEDFTDFIHFSSAKTRLENFYYKASLIEQYSSSIASLASVTGSSTSIIIFENKISDIIKNFDGYDTFLYYNSGSSKTWPKTTTEPPYLLAKTGSTEVVNWYGSDNEVSAYYGGMILSSSDFDNQNPDQLLKSIPEYLREDPQNKPYELFVDMVAQYYDSVWLYTKDITQKYNADNRLDFGISKDLVADAIKDFGVKLYQNNFSNQDLYTAFLGMTPSGSLFPFPNITGSTPVPSGFELVNTMISASNDVISMDDTNKSLYKRIYHNIPYLLKSKGTIPGLRALITSYGIPDTILRISEFGGKDKVNENDWDYYFHKFNYAWDTQGDNSLRTPWELNPEFSPTPYTSSLGNPMPGTIEFRFKTPGIPDTKLSQSLWHTTSSAGIDKAVVLEYHGSGSLSGSYSGSIPDPYNEYGYLKYISEPGTAFETSCSIYLPFFNGDWWSVMVRNNGFDAFDPEYIITEPVDYDFIMNEDLGKYVIRERSNTGSIDETGSIALYAANKIYNGNDGTQIGFTRSASITTSSAGSSWFSGATSSFGKGFTPTSEYGYFTGSMQEIRYYNIALGTTRFYDYTMNPLSIEGNGVNASPNQLAFRASLGSEGDLGPQENEIVTQNSNVTFLTTQNGFIYVLQPGGAGGSLGGTSIHPKITGSWDKIDSFVSNSIYEFEKDVLVKENREYFFLDQPAVGIKNRITDKIRYENVTIPSGSVLSPIRSLSQATEASASYTDNLNYLEVAFSPQNEINDDIINQIGYFNIGTYIGDPRQRFTGNRYKELNYFSEEYFLKYIKNYNLTDFVRLIKFFDNSLFKMIKDFIPVRTSLASGLVIKQHLLERNKYPQPSMSFEDRIYTGSIDMYDISGSSGGAFNRFNGLTTSPYGATGSGPDNRFFITQSWTSSHATLSGSVNKIQDSQREFYDGIFSGSNIDVTDGVLAGKDCFPQTNLMEVYGIRVYDSSSDYSTSKFLSYNNEPTDGYISLFNEPIQSSSYLDVPPIETSSFVEIPNTPFTLKLVKFEFGNYIPGFIKLPLFNDYSKYRDGNRGGYGPDGTIAIDNTPTPYGTLPSNNIPIDGDSYQIPRENSVFGDGLTAFWTLNETNEKGDSVSFFDENSDDNNFYSLAAFNQNGELILDLEVKSISCDGIRWNTNSTNHFWGSNNHPNQPLLEPIIDKNIINDHDVIRFKLSSSLENNGIDSYQGWAKGALNNNEAYRIRLELQSTSTRGTATTQTGPPQTFIFSPSAAWRNEGYMNQFSQTSLGSVPPKCTSQDKTENVKSLLYNYNDRFLNWRNTPHTFISNFKIGGSNVVTSAYNGNQFEERFNGNISNLGTLPDDWQQFNYQNPLIDQSVSPATFGPLTGVTYGPGGAGTIYDRSFVDANFSQVDNTTVIGHNNWSDSNWGNATVFNQNMGELRANSGFHARAGNNGGESGDGGGYSSAYNGSGDDWFWNGVYGFDRTYTWNFNGTYPGGGNGWQAAGNYYRDQMYNQDYTIPGQNFINGGLTDTSKGVALVGVESTYDGGRYGFDPMFSHMTEEYDLSKFTANGTSVGWVKPYVIKSNSDYSGPYDVPELLNYTATPTGILRTQLTKEWSVAEFQNFFRFPANSIQFASGTPFGSGFSVASTWHAGGTQNFYSARQRNTLGFTNVSNYSAQNMQGFAPTRRLNYMNNNGNTTNEPVSHSDYWKIGFNPSNGEITVRYEFPGHSTRSECLSNTGQTYDGRYLQAPARHMPGRFYLIFGVVNGAIDNSSLEFPNNTNDNSATLNNNYGPFVGNTSNQYYGITSTSWYAIPIQVL